jgi:hypothetical protein
VTSLYKKVISGKPHWYLREMVDPCSKRGFADWWRTTAADRFTKIPASALDHRRFWDAMHAVPLAALPRIEEKLALAACARFGLDAGSVALDMTNFATFIDTGNARAPIAQRGNARQKRADLRLVGLGLVVTRGGGIPLLSHAYPGNKPDVTQFPQMIRALAARHAALAAATGQGGAEMTVVFDAGQNSEANFALLAGTGLRYVGSVPASDCRDLLARGKTRRARDKVEAEITKITHDAWVRRVITWELTGDAPRDLRLAWSVDTAARAALEEEIFGKHVLITDHDDWPAAEVIAAYRSRSEARLPQPLSARSSLSGLPERRARRHRLGVDHLADRLARLGPGVGRQSVGDEHVDLVQARERAQAHHAPLGVIGQQYDAPRDPDEGPVGLGLGEVGGGQPGLRIEAEAPEEQQVEVERPDGQVGDGADQRVGGRTHAAGQDHRVGRPVEPTRPAERVHHGQRVGHDGQPGHVQQALGQRQRGRPGRDRDGGPRPDQPRRGAGDRVLLRALEDELGLQARLMAGGWRPRQDGAPVDLFHQAIPGQDLKVPADRHVRNAESLGEIAHPRAAVAPDGLQDERLTVSG